MAIIADAASWVYNDILKRGDITGICNDFAVDAYKFMCKKVPFDALYQLTAELPMAAGNDTYDLSTVTPTIAGIASIRVTYNTNTKRRLKRSHPRVYDALSFSTPGRPATYARFGNTIQFNPPPDSNVYTYRIRYWSQPTLAAPPENSTFLPPDEWFVLLKWETLYPTYYALDMPEKAMSLMQPPVIPRGQPSTKKLLVTEAGIIPRLWNDLLTTVSQKENVDEDFSVNPVIRPYSYR